MAQYTNRDKVYYLTEEEFNECDQMGDHNGVTCIFIEEAADWLPIEPFCDNCGFVEGDCECEEPDIIPVNTFIKIIRISS
jgi:hypothetical protein